MTSAEITSKSRYEVRFTRPYMISLHGHKYGKIVYQFVHVIKSKQIMYLFSNAQ